MPDRVTDDMRHDAWCRNDEEDGLRGVIRIGDSTSHGGKVVTGRDPSIVMGRAVACVGDRCTCPESGHGDCMIIEGDDKIQIDGRAVAFDGHKTSCGATLISSVIASGLA